MNAYNINPSSRHRYLLGREVLVDALFLSRCDGLIHGSSNVSEFARFINHGEYSYRHNIMNGINSDNRFWAHYQYRIKSHLPRSLGGLSGRIERCEAEKLVCVEIVNAL